VALVGLAAGISVALATRYVSLGSMLASLCVFFAMLVLALLAVVNPLFALYGLVAAGLIIWQHRTNIARLQEGTENKLGVKPDKKGQ
jgi:glycerol-3-phosphate acyltransferase PlsY